MSPVPCPLFPAINMTTSVADKTPTRSKVWRRHNDPPGLWFGVALGSASLHLLAFWLIRSSNAVGLWFPQENQSAVSIELIDVPPQSNSTDKPATRQPQQSAPTTTTAPPTSTNQDAEIINSDEQSQPENNSSIAQSQPEVVPQAESTPTPTATTEPEPTPTATTEPEPTPTATTEPEPTPTATTEPEPTPTATTEPEPAPTPTPTVPVGEFPWKRREEIELGQGQQLPSDIPPVTPEQVQESPAVEEQTPRGNEDTPATSETANSPPENSSSNPNGETANSPSENSSQNPSGETASTPPADNSPSPNGEPAKIPTERYTPTPTEEPANTATENNSSNSTARGAMSSDKPLSVYATLSFLPEAEVRKLPQASDLPEVLVQYAGSPQKTVDSSYLPGDFTIQPAQLLASLLIDKDGNFQQAVVLTIEPSSLQAQRGVYVQLVTDLFKNEKFTPAQNRNGDKPEVSNFFVKITIQPTSQ